MCACDMVAESCWPLFDPMVWSTPPPPTPARLLCSWDFPGKKTGVGSQFLLQGIFPTQGSNIHWQAGSLPLSHRGSTAAYKLYPNNAEKLMLLNCGVGEDS